ncbi:cellulase family glycosylhydrolase [Fictibacillus fluitans]|uniref:Cellulase family glycosylhydrolase n=1 Tax=Fictibacillus fluitans TaxID=3058422 RepID=A0ABT8HU11_9BACL|nr:cellulase family glycosylhydrolase [Fictibacillus sp. NE201]MDN4523970.1 cellulase family glycosylhydrolase [Fictibacillus sp. NE201]
MPEKDITPDTPLGSLDKILNEKATSNSDNVTKALENKSEHLKVPEWTNNELAPQIPKWAMNDIFFVNGTSLYDPNARMFTMRGVNNPHIWFLSQSYNALSSVQEYGANSVRIVWGFSRWKSSPTELEKILKRCQELKLIAIVELHDGTCKSQPDLYNMAGYFAQKDISSIMKKYSKYTLINIANEWGSENLSNSSWYSSYKKAITIIRDAGLKHPIIIDSLGCGQLSSPIIIFGKSLLAHDPLHNVLFSIHMYEKWNNTKKIATELQAINDLGLCVIIGEFGYNSEAVINKKNDKNCKVDAFEVMKQCHLKKIGYLAWSWTANDSKNEWLNLVDSNDWEEKTEWGKIVFSTQYGIENTSKIASIFL